MIVKLEKKAQKYLDKLSLKAAERIIKELDGLQTLQGDIKKMRGEESYRLRIGELRAIFEIHGETISVTKIAPRGDVYNN